MEAGSLPAPKASKLLLGLPLALLAGLIALVLALAMLLGATPGCGGGEAVGGLNAKVPRRLAPIYEQAAVRYRLGAKGPAVLAAINFVETNFGTNVATSAAGANGWMAFMPATWEEWGVDADNDGRRDPYDPEDAIFAAANYLHDSGAPADWREAVFAYNHADWYVDKVLRYAKRFAGRGEVDVAATACAAAALAPNEAVARMVAEAERLSARRPQSEYVWGGSHGESPTPADGPFDCSSAVSHILQVGGLGNRTMATPELARWGEPGPGQWVTVFVKPYGGDAHTFIRFAGGLTPPPKRYWGTSGFVEPGRGPGFIPESAFSAGYLAGFLQRHQPGL